MSNSPLVDMVRYSPNHSGRRNQKITKIAIHHAAGVINAYNLVGVFAPRLRKASANYCLGSDAKIALCVDEINRSWCTSSAWCDNRAVTIEVGNSSRGPQWLVSDKVLNRLIDLVYDICKRNDIYPCTYTGGKDGVLQKHEWYSNTNCPGPYLGSKFPYIAEEVTRRLAKDRGIKTENKPTPQVKPNYNNGDLYRVTANALNIRKGPGTNYGINGVIRDKGVYTIIEKKGSWGRLKSGAGWISLNYARLAGGQPVAKQKPQPAAFKVGDIVTVRHGAKSYSGQRIASFVYKGAYRIDELKGNRAVLDKKGICTAFNTKDLNK